MPAYHVQRSTQIDASPEKVFDAVSDYGTWTTWSPWLGIDPDAEVKVSDDPKSVGGTYHWNGELTGEGILTHEKLDAPRRMEDRLDFVKPFKSTCQVHFDVVPESETTKVTWHMRGKLPWFLFWMKPNMEMFIGMDYERGLSMLKEYIETGRVLSKVEVLGAEERPAMTVTGVRDQCSMKDIDQKMKVALEKALRVVDGQGGATDQQVLSVYHATSDLKKQFFDFTSGVTSDGSSVPADLERCEVPGGKFLKVRHTGSYENLGNAWSGSYQYARYKKMKIAKRASYEIYVNDPSDTPPESLVTDIYLPLKQARRQVYLGLTACPAGRASAGRCPDGLTERNLATYLASQERSLANFWGAAIMKGNVQRF